MPWKSSALDDSLCSFFFLFFLFFFLFPLKQFQAARMRSRAHNNNNTTHTHTHTHTHRGTPALTHSKLWRDVWAREALYRFTAPAFPLQEQNDRLFSLGIWNNSGFQKQTRFIARGESGWMAELPAPQTSALRGREEQRHFPFAPPFSPLAFPCFIPPGPRGRPPFSAPLKPKGNLPPDPSRRLRLPPAPRGGAVAPR